VPDSNNHSSKPTNKNQTTPNKKAIQRANISTSKENIKILGFLPEKGQRQQWHKREAKGTAPAQPQTTQNSHNIRYAQLIKQTTHNHKRKTRLGFTSKETKQAAEGK
jgi:hypothetical protein